MPAAAEREIEKREIEKDREIDWGRERAAAETLSPSEQTNQGRLQSELLDALVTPEDHNSIFIEAFSLQRLHHHPKLTAHPAAPVCFART